MSERPKVQHSKCCVVSQPPWVQIPALPPLPPGPNGAGRFCYAWMVCERVCWGRAAWCALLGRAAWCARGRRPAREPSAPRASLGASPRSPARPRRRPRAPQPGPPAPSTPAALVSLCVAGCVASKPGQAPPPPTGTAAWPSGTLHTGGACVAVTSTARPYRMGTAAWVSGLSTQWRPVADVDWCVGSKPARALRALRALRYPPHGGACVAVRGWARRLEAWPGSAPPTGTAAHGFHSLAQQVLRYPPCWSCKPPSGGGEITVRGGVMPKVQTTSAKNAENGLLWAKWSAFWAHRYLSQRIART